MGKKRKAGNRSAKQAAKGKPRWMWAGVLAPLVVIAAFLMVRWLAPPPSSPAGAHPASGRTLVQPAILNLLERLPAGASGSGANSYRGGPLPAGGPPLVSRKGKPEVLYVGAEYCPYCAAENWALVTALSHFGRFSRLHYITSSMADIYPGTATFTFYGSKYQSAGITFRAVELAGNTLVNGRYPPLESPSPQEKQIMARYDPKGNIPFLDIGGRYVQVGSAYSPALFQGLTQAHIAGRIAEKGTPLHKAVLNAAAVLIRDIDTVRGAK
ncbi:MAG: DUF929 family protein [Peptococcaceae bacterium]|jgi:thiol-disulfide isomerase/thioredoxin|nr:DUF929 family protein [Peptococcaceae bacterium]